MKKLGTKWEVAYELVLLVSIVLFLIGAYNDQIEYKESGNIEDLVNANTYLILAMGNLILYNIQPKIPITNRTRMVQTKE